jgi:hypothetical protein
VQFEAYLRLAELLMGSRITMALWVVTAKDIPDMLGDDIAVIRSFARHRRSAPATIRRI